MNPNITIIEYEDKYSKEIVNHIRKIAMDEFGYNKWKDYLDRMNFEEYKTEESKFWLALNDKDEVVGTIGALRKSHEEVYLNSLYLNKDYRKLGIATKLYNTFTNFIEEKEYKIITLRTFFKFVEAIKFYEKLGFKRYDKDEVSYYYRKYL